MRQMNGDINAMYVHESERVKDVAVTRGVIQEREGRITREGPRSGEETHDREPVEARLWNRIPWRNMALCPLQFTCFGKTMQWPLFRIENRI